MTNNSGWYESLYRLPSVLYGVGDETSTIQQFSSSGWQILLMAEIPANSPVDMANISINYPPGN